MKVLIKADFICDVYLYEKVNESYVYLYEKVLMKAMFVYVMPMKVLMKAMFICNM